MKAALKGAPGRAKTALLSKQARGPELALARLVIAALGVKLGLNFKDWLAK